MPGRKCFFLIEAFPIASLRCRLLQFPLLQINTLPLMFVFADKHFAIVVFSSADKHIANNVVVCVSCAKSLTGMTYLSDPGFSQSSYY